MDSHPSYPVLSPFLSKFPKGASSLFQTYNDIVYAQQWREVEVFEIKQSSRAAIRGKKKDSEELCYVLPCTISETISFAWLTDAFSELRTNANPLSADSIPTNQSTAPFLYLAITSQDASIVYYKISSGIVKPPV